MKFVVHDPARRDGGYLPGFFSFRRLRYPILLLLCSLPLCAPLASAKETCPWLNEATAAGFLGASVTSVVTHPASNRDDATCEFKHQDKSEITVLRIEVETMSEPRATAFASYTARCGFDATPLRAIGNEAILCSLSDRKNQISDQVIGRVRDRAFIVKISSTSESFDHSALRLRA
jgi:hypothetical protein